MIENLMDEMRELGVGMPDNDNEDEDENEDTWGTEERGRGGGSLRVGGHADGENGLRVPSLSSDCYASLVEAYAHASMWGRTIEAYHQGFGGGVERVGAVDYRVSFADARGGVGCRRGSLGCGTCNSAPTLLAHLSFLLVGARVCLAAP